jgi:hypothetical protein
MSDEEPRVLSVHFRWITPEVESIRPVSIEHIVDYQRNDQGGFESYYNYLVYRFDFGSYQVDARWYVKDEEIYLNGSEACTQDERNRLIAYFDLRGINEVKIPEPESGYQTLWQRPARD